MTRRILATGQTLVNNGARVFSVGGAGPGGGPIFTEITAMFAASIVPHYHYEVGDVGFVGESFAGMPIGAAAPTGSTVVGGGTYWVLCSTNPPGPGIWPNGSTEIELTTTDRQQSGRDTGTMKWSGAGARVHRANNLVMWIPAVYSGANATPMTWDVDF